MLCCLLIGMLLAQVAALFRRGRAWLARRPRRLAAFVAAQAIAVAVVALHWDHLVHEVRSLAGPVPAQASLAPAQGPICSAETASVATSSRTTTLPTPGDAS